MEEIIFWIVGIIVGVAVVYYLMTTWKKALNVLFMGKYGISANQYLYCFGIFAIIGSWGMDYDYYAIGIIAVIINIIYLIFKKIKPLDFINVLIWHTLLAALIILVLLVAFCLFMYGLMVNSSNKTCRTCDGSGVHYGAKCLDCNGTGYE